MNYSQKMQELKANPLYEHTWMQYWVAFDELSQKYFGYSPENDVLAEHTDPTEFLSLFLEAAKHWTKAQETDLDEERGL